MSDNPLQHSLDILLRPQTWEEYVGQENIKETLHILLEAAKTRNQMPEHVLLHGSAGLGKTTLAHLVGLVLRVPVQVTSGAVIERSGDIVSIASTLEQGGVLFIDEIHRLNKTAEEVLYPIMETGGVDVLVGKGPSARSVHISLPPIMVFAATTQIGKLSAPLRSRFSGGILKLEQYTEKELTNIILQSAKTLAINISKEAAERIASRSRSTPRVANYLLKRVRDYAQVHNKPITDILVDEALQNRNIDAYGLTAEDRHLLSTIYEVFNGGPVGVQALAATLSEDVSTIEEVYEPFLIQIGFLKRTPRGRSITEKGKQYLESEL